MKRVFISHPYKDDPKGNKKRMDTICRELARKGDILIDICDEVWIYGDSEGCEKERDYALSRGKKVLNKCGD